MCARDIVVGIWNTVLKTVVEDMERGSYYSLEGSLDIFLACHVGIARLLLTMRARDRVGLGVERRISRVRITARGEAVCLAKTSEQQSNMMQIQVYVVCVRMQEKENLTRGLMQKQAEPLLSWLPNNHPIIC